MVKINASYHASDFAAENNALGLSRNCRVHSGYAQRGKINHNQLSSKGTIPRQRPGRRTNVTTVYKKNIRGLVD